MRFLFLLLLIHFTSISYSTNDNTKSPYPGWVQKVNYPDDKTHEDNGGYQYLLIDLQDNLIEQSIFRHYVVKVLNSEGIQSVSDIDITYDPTFQKLQLHKVQIIRDGRVINKINDSKIQTIQRETSMERSSYDGSLSTIINLTDVRENDIIDYSYSIVGFNPINKGNFSSTYYHQFTIPINRVFNRLITSQKNNIHYKLYDGASEPKIKKINNQIEYSWDVVALDNSLYDNNVPSWYDSQKRVSFSTFNNWKEVVDWALPLYKYSNSEVNKINKSLSTTSSGETKILELIRFVQDEIRYLGFESGIGAYKPHNPSKVFNQRYGDCKDKSLLLVSLLQSEGFTAYPMFVNTQLKDEVSTMLPSFEVFNHCVAYINYNGKDYFIDPTVSNQGGNLERISFPNYKKGLIIESGQTELITIPEKKTPSIDIQENIFVESIGGEAKITVRSEYTGSRADYNRSYFNTNSKESIQKEYLNFYSHLYPDIEVDGEINFYDSNRNTTNSFVVEEYYRVKEFWLNSDDTSYIYFEVYPLVLETIIDFPKSAERNMPYYLGGPLSFSQTTVVTLPEDWAVTDADVLIEADGFQYKNTATGIGEVITVTYDYELDKNFISGNSVDQFLSKNEEIKNGLSFILSYNDSLTKFKLSWASVFIAILTIVIGVILSVKIYRNFNPKTLEHDEDTPLGGWMILPLIGLTFTPFLLIYQIIDAEYFNQNNWLGLFSYEAEKSMNLVLFVGAELVYNTLLMVFTVLLLVLFYKRRSSVPTLISIYYLVAFIFPLLDMLLIEQILPGQMTDADTKSTYNNIMRSFFAAAIWIPYFNISKRVKKTFRFSYKKIN